MGSSNDFSTNRHSSNSKEIVIPIRHPDLCFNDGNIAILSNNNYFLVHQGLLCRHSEVLKTSINALQGRNDDPQSLEGCPVLHLQDSPEDIASFLVALYDGMCVYGPGAYYSSSISFFTVPL